jgi:hypothetical protein
VVSHGAVEDASWTIVIERQQDGHATFATMTGHVIPSRQSTRARHARWSSRSGACLRLGFWFGLWLWLGSGFWGDSQRDLDVYPWPGRERVRVRIGVHTGTPTVHGGAMWGWMCTGLPG